MGFLGQRLVGVAVIAAGIGVAVSVFAILPVPSPVINPKILQKKVTPSDLKYGGKSIIKKPVFEVKSKLIGNPVSPAIMADLCKRNQLECLVTLLREEPVNGPTADIFPIEWVHQCAEAQDLSCAQHRWRHLLKIIPSPPAPQLPPVIGDVDYAIECEDESGMCSLKYYTDYINFSERSVWQSENNCEISASDPIPGDGNDPPPPLCNLIYRDPFTVAIEGEMVQVEFAGTFRGCVVPRVQGALPLAHRNFDANRDRDYTEIVDDRVLPRQECRGSYRVTLRNGRRCDVPCYYMVDHLIFDGSTDDDNLGCLIGLGQPVCR